MLFPVARLHIRPCDQDQQARGQNRRPQRPRPPFLAISWDLLFLGKEPVHPRRWGAHRPFIRSPRAGWSDPPQKFGKTIPGWPPRLLCGRFVSEGRHRPRVLVPAARSFLASERRFRSPSMVLRTGRTEVLAPALLASVAAPHHGRPRATLLVGVAYPLIQGLSSPVPRPARSPRASGVAGVDEVVATAAEGRSELPLPTSLPRPQSVSFSAVPIGTSPALNRPFCRRGNPGRHHQ